MTIPDTQAIALIVSIATALGYIGKRLVDGYVENIKAQSEGNARSLKLRDELLTNNITTQTDSLTTLLGEHRAHDKLSAQSHGAQCDALKEITETLRRLNGGDKHVHGDNSRV